MPGMRALTLNPSRMYAVIKACDWCKLGLVPASVANHMLVNPRSRREGQIVKCGVVLSMWLTLTAGGRGTGAGAPKAGRGGGLEQGAPGLVGDWNRGPQGQVGGTGDGGPRDARGS